MGKPKTVAKQLKSLYNQLKKHHQNPTMKKDLEERIVLLEKKANYKKTR